MIAQETLFDIALPPEPPKPTVVAEPLGLCIKCGKDAERRSPSGTLYCAECGKCGGKTVEQTALGINVRICGTSVEEFVKHPRLGIYVCPCVEGM